MSDSNDNPSGLSMEQFNINELAGATGLILGAVSGILVVIFKSRCYCKFRIGISDKWNICMCERKPPPDPKQEESEEEETTDKEPEKLIPTKSKEPKPEPEPEPEPEIRNLV
jgi:hypothetical protein